MATGAARRSESCQTVKVTAALVGSLAETSQPAGRQGLIPHSVPQAFILTRPELNNNKLSGTVDQQGAFFLFFFFPNADALHPSTCSIFRTPPTSLQIDSPPRLLFCRALLRQPQRVSCLPSSKLSSLGVPLPL